MIFHFKSNSFEFLVSRTFFLFAILFCWIGTVSADYVLYKEALFGKSYNSNSVGSYDASWTSKTNGFIVSMNRWSNGDNKWNYIKASASSAAVVPTIATYFSIDKPISKVSISIANISNVESITLYSNATNSSGTWDTNEGKFPLAVGEQSVLVSNPLPNRYYKIVVSFSSKGGQVSVNRIGFHTFSYQIDWVVNGTSVKQDKQLWGDSSFSPEVNVDNGYSLLGWSEDEQVESIAQPTLVDMRNNTDLTVKRNITLHAVYKRFDELLGTDTYSTVLGAQMTVGTAGFSTLYYSDRALVVPEGVKATTYGILGDVLQVRTAYNPNDVIPAGEAVVVFSEEAYHNKTATSVTFWGGKTDAVKDNENLLLGTDDITQLDDDEDFYFLGLSRDTNGENIGFYFMNMNGSAFTNGAHKAYLKLLKSKAVDVKSFCLEDAITSQLYDIQKEHSLQQNNTVFNLSGQHIVSPKKGLYIINGKKYVLK